MARPSRCRRICSEPEYSSFAPQGAVGNETVTLTVDEYETIRLIDLEDKTQEQCALQMDISRTTVMEIYGFARRKIADCIINGKQLIIEGGNYRFCDGTANHYCQKNCCKAGTAYSSQIIMEKGDNIMRIAVTYSNGEVFQHFGHSEQFKIYDVDNGKIVNSQVIDTNGQGHGALSGLLSALQIGTLICGGIGGGAINALAQANITVYGGVTGSADNAVQALIEGKLIYNPNVQCSHHSGEHSCGAEKHGCQGN